MAALAASAALLGASVTPLDEQPGGASRQGRPASTRKQVLAWADVRFGNQHESVSRALATIDRLGEQSRLWDTWIRTDSDVITKKTIAGRNLDSFDAIFFYGVREIALTPDQREDLLAFVRDDGKGFVAAHTATTAFFSWPEFGEMLGARFDGHPWGITEAPVVIEDPAFPAMAHFPPVMTFREEFYQHKDFSRERLRVLARIDQTKLDLSRAGVNRTDGDFPMAWVKPYGKGRVFYSAFGHPREAWANPYLETMWLEAMKWALGLTDADHAPRPRPGGGQVTNRESVVAIRDLTPGPGSRSRVW